MLHILVLKKHSKIRLAEPKFPPRPLWLAEDTGETEVGCGINQGQAGASRCSKPCPGASSCPFASVAGDIRELGAALARCSADISFSVLWLCCASAQSTRVRLGALAGEYGRMTMMSQPESVASEDASTLR